MHDVWGVLRKDEQVSYLQGPLQVEMVSLDIFILLTFFFFLYFDAWSFQTKLFCAVQLETYRS
jgi:hypothetical protein